jgi:hypothetical protein
MKKLNYISNIDYSKLTFVNISQAKRLTGISYIGGYNISQKVNHSFENSNVLTYIIYLQPGIIDNYNFCPCSTKECRLTCLCNSGRSRIDQLAGLNRITNCKIKRNKLFLQNRKFYFDWIIAEIRKYQKIAIDKNMYFAVRLNGTSDIDYINLVVSENKNIFQLFPEIQFYDYTANIKLYDNKPGNLHLTFSYKGTNKNKTECLNILRHDENITIVFNIAKNKPLPETYLNYKVINGDFSDYRPNDEKNCIVGLRFKKVTNKLINENIQNSKFVVTL